MKIAEITALSTDALRARLSDVKEELMKLRFQAAAGSLTDTSVLRQTRRDIARINTVLAQRVAEEEGDK